MVPWHMQPKYSGEQLKPVRENKPRKQRKKKSKIRETSGSADCASVVATEQPQRGDSSAASPFWCDLPGIGLSEGDGEEVECGGVPAASARDTTSEADGKCRDTDTAEKSVGQSRLDRDDTDSCANPVQGLESASIGSTKPIENKLFESKGCAESDSTSTTRPNLAELGYRTFNRYYHVFQKGELVRLFAQVPCALVREEFYDHENWCVLAEKLSSEY